MFEVDSRMSVSGASGLIGQALCRSLEATGLQVLRLVRHESRLPQEVLWDPERDRLDLKKLRGSKCVFHLAGKNIAASRWTPALKEEIRLSRVKGTRFLCSQLASLDPLPEVFVCASAVGFYGDRGGELLDESAAQGDGFLPDLCVQWESACEPLLARGVRVVHARFGVVLNKNGGALARMLLPFRLGLGGKLGSGEQYLSWIELSDAVRALRFCAETPSLRGPVNLVSPNPCTNADFTKALGRVLHRPTFCNVPAVLLRKILGEMADALLLSGSRVVPQRLIDAGFVFEHSELVDALKVALA